MNAKMSGTKLVKAEIAKGTSLIIILYSHFLLSTVIRDAYDFTRTFFTALIA